ncbi:MAG: hypothetical protein V3V20_06685, partial [Algisphaera sp.]
AWGEKGGLNAYVGEGLGDESWAEGRIYPAGNPWFFGPGHMMKSPTKQRLLDTISFMHDLQGKFYDRFEKAIRDTGYEGVIMTSNWQAGQAFSHFSNLHADSRFDIIDRHNYFNGAGSMLARPGGGMLSSGMQQVAGLPFMLSEWIHVFPNEYGVEGPAILGAYGMGLNGWDVSFIFQNMDSGEFRKELKDAWDFVAPQVLGVFPAVARQVYRGDVKESDVTFVRKVHEPSLVEGKLGFEDMVEQGYDNKEFSSDVAPASTLAMGRGLVEFTDAYETSEKVDMAKYTREGVLHSSTEELAWTPGASAHDGHIAIDTPGTQAVVGFASGVVTELADVTITLESNYAAVYVTALSPKGTLASDKNLLVTTIARVRNTGMKMVVGEMVARGEGPMLVEPVKVEIQLNRKGSPKVYVLDHDGRRTDKQVKVNNGKIVLDGAKTHAMYYEIVY